MDYFHNSMFRYENLPRLTAITNPVTFGGNIDNLTQTAYLDLSKCSNLWFQIVSGNLNLNFSGFTELTEMTYVGSNLSSAPLTALTGFTPPTISKLTIYRISKSTFSNLDLSSSNLLQTFEFCNNPNITNINLTNCINLITIRIGFSSNGNNIPSTNALSTLTLPTSLNSCTLLQIRDCTSLSALNLPSLTSCVIAYFYTIGSPSVTFNSNISSNADVRFYNNSSLTTINNFPNNAKNIYLDTCNNLSAINGSLFSTILSSDRTKLILSFCSSFTFTNPDLSLLTSCTEYRSDGINISGNFTLPSSNTMTRFSASNITSINRFSTSLISLYITTSSTLTDVNFCNGQSPKIPNTVAIIVINNTLLDSSINDISHLTASNFNIYLNNNNLTSFTFPLVAKNFNTNLQSRPVDSQNTNVNLGAGINLSNNPNLTSLINFVGVNHNFSPISTNAGVFNMSNTDLDMEFPFGKVNNTNLRPHFISLNSMPSMSLLNLYLSLKNIYDNKTAWSDYNSGNGSTIPKSCNLNNTIISTKITLQPFGFILGDNSPVVTPVDGFIQLESWVSGTAYPVNHVVLYSGSYYKRSVITDNNTDPLTNTTDWTLYTLADIDYNNAMREMKHVLELQGQVTSTTLKYRWTITL